VPLELWHSSNRHEPNTAPQELILAAYESKPTATLQQAAAAAAAAAAATASAHAHPS